MKSKLLFIILILVLIAGCGKTQTKLIPAGYEDPSYCKTDSDCRYQSNSCCGTEVNKYHHVKGNYVGPTCHTQCVSVEFLDFYCNNNKCDRKIDCSNCEEINEFMERVGCFQEMPSVIVQIVKK
jgi:hypothetical protein